MISFLHNHSLGLLILRLMVGCLMLFHGAAKIMHPDSLNFISGALSSVGLPSFLAYGVYIGEVIAPLMIIAGIFSRYAGLILVIDMLFAIFLVHTGDVFLLTEHGGWRLELQAFYLFGAKRLMTRATTMLALPYRILLIQIQITKTGAKRLSNKSILRQYKSLLNRV